MKVIEVRLKDRGLEQKELTELTGLTTRAISELVNKKTVRYPKNALEKIAEALDITDMNELLIIRETKEE